MSKLSICTEFNADEIRQSLISDSDIIKNHTADIIRLKEQGVIDALIALGWTPPEGVFGSKKGVSDEGTQETR